AVTAILMGVSFGGAAVGIGAAAALAGVSVYLSPVITSISISIGIFAIAQLKFIAKEDNMFKVTETPLEDTGKYLLKVSVATLLTSAIAAGGSAVSVVITPIVAVAASSPILGKITGTVSSIAINIFLSAGVFFVAEHPNILNNNSDYVVLEL
ncbi:hypothetical protein N9Y92_04320, partial [Chlamydiales bacterium]|nr:hypothetical protein [Chlamydiales bacterium]